MYINDRDQINYHGFLKAVREMQGATLKQVAEGICSDSEISRMEIGDRLPEKLMRDRVTSRLGVSGEEYEEYLRPEEYRQWEIRMFILDHLNKGDAKAVQKGIDEFDKIPDKNPVQEQFADTMRYMLAKMNGASENLLRALIELTVVHTIPDVEAAFAGAQLLADQELNLITEYTHLREFPDNAEDEVAWRLAEYQKILDYIDKSYMDTIGKSKVYPRVACYVSELILKESPELENLEYALNLCSKSIELLRDANRLYYLVELLEYRKKMISQLLKIDVADPRVSELQEVYDKDSEWETLFKELYTEYDVPVYMENFTYLYVETECNSVVEVIRTRRNMLKLSRVKVSDNICTEKTVERFENYTHSPSIVVIRDIFDRIKLCGEYKRARIVTDNAKMLELVNQVAVHINSWKREESESGLTQLAENIHMDISYNQQAIKRLRNVLASHDKEYNSEVLYRDVLDALECTIPFEAVIRKNNIYLERAELFCIYDLAFKTKGEVSGMCYKIIEDMCEVAFGSDINATRLCVFEILGTELSSNYGDRGMHEDSIKLSKRLMKECLTHRRLLVLVSNLYNIIWNYEKKAQIDKSICDKNIIVKELRKCISLSELDRKTNWVAFLQRKLENISSVD